jgi:hypothetical protein
VPFGEELVATFKRYFDVVKAAHDKPTIENPFYLLSGDKFWRVTPRGGNEPLYQEGSASGAPSEEKFFPAVERLRWREEHLTASTEQARAKPPTKPYGQFRPV